MPQATETSSKYGFKVNGAVSMRHLSTHQGRYQARVRPANRLRPSRTAQETNAFIVAYSIWSRWTRE
jgi:hypothetical protein